MFNNYARRFLPRTRPVEEEIWRQVRDFRMARFLEKTLIEGDKALDREFTVENGGKTKIYAVSVLPMVQDGSVSGSLIKISDKTEKRNREARLRRAENLASLTTLAAGVAHEIKNPLGSISIHVQLIKKLLDRESEESVDPKMRQYLGVVNEEIDRLNHIVVDFLFAVRPMDMVFILSDLNDVVRDTAEFVRFELEDAGIALELQLDESLPSAELDERFMKQALLNLVKNAIAACPDGGTLTLKTEKSDNEVLLRVQDTGTGIAEEHLARIFDPYWTTKDSGSGLGLTLVFKIIKEHRGEITVSSTPGEGTCFTISIPVPQGDALLLADNRGVQHEI
jgi:signal transduction histidine kinase